MEANERRNAKIGSTTWTLWRVRKTALEMCHDRGYMVTAAELEETLEEFLSKFVGEREYCDELTVLLEHQFDHNNQVFIFFPPTSDIGRGAVVDYSKRMHENNVNHGIIISENNLTPAAKQHIRELAPKLFIEHFLERELLVNITHHKCVPKHILLSASAKQDLLNKYGVKEHQLQALRSSDPVVRYFGAKPGQVFRILRPSETGGRYAHYKIVVQFSEN